MKDKLSSPLIEKYESALEKNPRSRVFAPLAELYRKLGMIDHSMGILKDGIRHNPEYVLGYLSLANCYFELKQFNLAYSTLRPLTVQSRDNISLQKLFARTCYELGHKEESLDTYKYLLFVNPRDNEAKSFVEKFELELSEVAVFEPQKASQFNIENISAQPKSVEESIDDWVAVDFSNEEDEVDEKPLEAPVEAWSLDTVNIQKSNEEKKQIQEQVTPVITHTLVDLYYNQGHLSKAVEILEKILALNPGNEETRKRLVELKAEQGEDIPVSQSAIVNINDLESDEGHSNLMKAFDEKVAEPDPSLNFVEEVLWKFHGALQKKAEQNNRN